MCGLYTLGSDPEEIRARFGLEKARTTPGRPVTFPKESLGWQSPSSRREGCPSRMTFGLPPAASGTRPLPNARSETVHLKPTFRELFRKRRCIVPATSFTEIRRAHGDRRPFRFRTEPDEPFGLAGIWKPTGRDKGGRVTCAFAILTAPAGALVRPVHDRMPVILAPEDEEAWLDPASDPEGLREMLGSHDGRGMTAEPA